MNVLTDGLGLAPIYISEDKSVAALSVEGKVIPEPNVGKLSASFDEYIEVLEHMIIEPYQSHRVVSRRVLCVQLLSSQLWYEVYKRYGSSLFKLLMGPYELYQLITSTSSYIQVSGRALSSTVLYGPVLSSITQATRLTQQTTPTQASGRILGTPRTHSVTPVLSKYTRSTHRVKGTPSGRFGGSLRFNRSKATDAALGSHLFVCQPQPPLSPDRLFGRMSFTKWYYGVFDTLPPADLVCPELKYLHVNLRNIAFVHLVEAATKKESTSISSSVFENAVPHWKLSLCKWLYSKSIAANTAERRQRFASLVRWLVRLINYIIKYFFYVTESREYRKRTLFFIRSYWQAQVESTLQAYTDSKMFVRTQTTQPANNRLRFLAGSRKLRPIISSIKAEVSAASHFRLMDVLASLKFIWSEEGTGVAKCRDVLHHLRQFSAYVRAQPSPARLYFVKADIAKCYDSINRILLLNIISARLRQLRVSTFIVWRIGVVLSGHSRPTVTYIDHVDTQSSINLSTVVTACRDYLQKKGIFEAIFVPIGPHEITAGQLLECVTNHLNNVLVTVQVAKEERKYRMCAGIPQGSLLSSILCDIYYGAMEQIFIDPAIQTNGNLLLRHVDDYLLLTRSRSCAAQFLTKLTSPALSVAFSCTIKKEKTITNIPKVDDEFERSQEPNIQWCQYVIDLLTGAVTLPHYSVQDVQNGISFDGTAKPLTHIRTQMLRHVSVFGNPIFIDSKINDVETLESNLAQIFRHCAVKFCYLQANLLADNRGVAKNPMLWLGVVLGLSQKLYKIVCNHHRRVGDVCSMTQTTVHILNLDQFYKVCGSWPDLSSLRKAILSKFCVLERRQGPH